MGADVSATSARSKRPGLGLKPDLDRIEAANEVYRKHALGARDDAAAMQFLIPGWRFDAKKSCLVR